MLSSGGIVENPFLLKPLVGEERSSTKGGTGSVCASSFHVVDDSARAETGRYISKNNLPELPPTCCRKMHFREERRNCGKR